MSHAARQSEPTFDKPIRREFRRGTYKGIEDSRIDSSYFFLLFFPPHTMPTAKIQSMLPALSQFSIVGRESRISPFFKKASSDGDKE